MPDIRDQIGKHVPRLRRYAHALAKNTYDADDLVQDTLLLAIRKHHLYKEGSDLRAWMFTILYHTYINNVRVKARLGDYGDDVEKVVIHVQERATSALLLRDLDRAFKKLPPDMLAPIVLIGIEGMSYEEAAEILATPVGTVRSRLWRGRQLLLKMMQWKPEKAPHGRANEPSHRPESNLSLEKSHSKHCIVSQNALVSSVLAPRPGSVYGSASTKNSSKVKEVCRG